MLYIMACGLGVYFREENQVLTAYAWFRNEFGRAVNAKRQTMLSFPPRVGDSTGLSVAMGGEDQLWSVLKVVGFESVHVPAGDFQHCAKIMVRQPSDPQIGYVWLAPSVGIVKCERTTGRVDELLSYSIPGNQTTEPEGDHQKMEKPTALASLDFEDVKGYRDGDYFYVKGRIRNNGSVAVTYVKVEVELLDKSGRVMDTDWTYAVSSEKLRPGAAKSFETMTAVDFHVESYRYKILRDD
jgi:hypothetical protein